MDTKAWGPPAWDTLFFIAAGYDLNEEDPVIKNIKYYNFFKSFGQVLPCRYCRDSYKGFFDELDMTEYFNKPCGVMRFAYDLKNKVNAKLWKQEDEAALEKFKQLLSTIQFGSDENTVRQLRDMATIFYTKDVPQFEKVVEKYMQHRAKCSPKLKSCRKDAINDDNTQVDDHNMTGKYFIPTDTNRTLTIPTDTMLYARNGGSKIIKRRSKKKSQQTKTRSRRRRASRR